MKNLLHSKKMNYRDLQTQRYSKGPRKGFGKRDSAYVIFFFAFLFTFFTGLKQHPIKFPSAQAETTKYVSPLAKFDPATPTLIPTATPTPVLDDQQTEIVATIRHTFGQYTDRAMKLLSCENSALNPEAINTAGNYPQGSMDIGVFQINNYWNGIGNVELLKDPAVNIAVAWKKFRDSGYSFNQWTCGRNMGL